MTNDDVFCKQPIVIDKTTGYPKAGQSFHLYALVIFNIISLRLA